MATDIGRVMAWSQVAVMLIARGCGKCWKVIERGQVVLFFLQELSREVPCCLRTMTCVPAQAQRPIVGFTRARLDHTYRNLRMLEEMRFIHPSNARGAVIGMRSHHMSLAFESTLGPKLASCCHNEHSWSDHKRRTTFLLTLCMGH